VGHYCHISLVPCYFLLALTRKGIEPCEAVVSATCLGARFHLRGDNPHISRQYYVIRGDIVLFDCMTCIFNQQVIISLIKG